jgi:hypothetical protein
MDEFLRKVRGLGMTLSAAACFPANRTLPFAEQFFGAMIN